MALAGPSVLGRGLLPIALVAGLVSAAPAAAEGPALPTLTEREQVLQHWKAGGAAVKSSAGAALAGSDAQVRAYLESGQKVAEDLDLREAALKLVTDAGPGLSEAAAKALAGTSQDVAAFMKDGWKQPLADDQRVLATQAIDAGGPGVHEAGNVAMRGSIDDIRAFLQEGQYKQRDDDARVRVTQIESAGGPATKRAAANALKSGIEEVRDFLTFGQHIARAQDQEHATIADLAKQTGDAGAAAEKAKQSAVAEAEKAKNAAHLAKLETAKAAQETELAKGDAIKAADAARRAAASARRAAAAAQTAIAAARAANAAAQAAAIAAHNASNAALFASRAATAAWDVAAHGKANAKVARDADDAAAKAEQIADLADATARTLEQADEAMLAAKKATEDMFASADHAVDSGEWAKESGLSDEEAQAAAASARRHAAEAKRASAAAQGHAADAVLAARQARDAARSAARHARNAAEAARRAVEHAGDAQAAANAAKVNAEQALASADLAADLLKKAESVHDAARKTEAEEVAARTISAVNQARDAKEAAGLLKTEVLRLEKEAVKLDADFTALAQQAAQPGADAKQIAVTGRKMALTALQSRGSWGLTAAEAALTGDDSIVVEYARTGWKKAREQDEREDVNRLSLESPYEDVRAAAATALKGTAGQVHDFLTLGQYKAAAPDQRIEVTRIGDAAVGGPADGDGIREAVKAALADPDPRALSDFLTTKQHQARIEDYRVEATRLSDGGGPEVKAAAEAALASPDTHLTTFIESGQYRAKRRDQLTATHVAEVKAVLAKSSGIVAQAYQDAYEAAEAAADAQGYADQADAHALTAAGYANQAAGYAAQARQSADNADKSANAAVASAATARKAENEAAYSARKADDSAASAHASYIAAIGYAESAYKAAEVAKTAALDAGMSAEAAVGKYRTTLDRYRVDEFLQSVQEALRFSANDTVDDPFDRLPSWLRTIYAIQGIRSVEDMWFYIDSRHAAIDVIGTIPGFELADGANCAMYALEGAIDHFWDTGRDGFFEDAALSCASMIPFAGWGATPAKWAKYADKFGPKAKEAYEELGKVWKKVGCKVGANSFPAGTRVLMGDGSAKPIEQVRVGDMVHAADPVTDIAGPHRVDATIYTPDDRDFTTITLDGADGGGTVTATGNHPFWSETTRTWTDAAALKAGEQLRISDDTTARIAGVRHWKTLQGAYNLTVNSLHTYNVLAGSVPVLVHNASKPRDMPNYVKKAAREVLAGIRPQRLKKDGTLDFYNGNELNGDAKKFWGTTSEEDRKKLPQSEWVTTRIYDVRPGDDGYRLIVRSKPGQPDKWAWVPPDKYGLHNYGSLQKFEPGCL
ncbi:polymorphic toxin-type HINT domain-containing protein [Streptomyces sp. NPDC002073]